MTFILGVIVGCLAMAVLQRLRKPATPPPNEAEQRRRQQALREYRNFMNYDGYTEQED
ncbi:MAG: hypothetical protein IKB04_09200 [Clostridia bacterium]|nr:hypothetical protein [Clostridia bacterium]MBR2407194.1 hypothetical protein [Clostridia bacterium]